MCPLPGVDTLVRLDTNQKAAPPSSRHIVLIDLADETCQHCGVPAWRTRKGWRHEHGYREMAAQLARRRTRRRR